jgi:hypothetical protein
MSLLSAPVCRRYDDFDIDHELLLAYLSLSDPLRVAQIVRRHYPSDPPADVSHFLWFLRCIALSWYSIEIEFDLTALLQCVLGEDRLCAIEDFFRLFCQNAPLFYGLEDQVRGFLNGEDGLRLFRKYGIDALNIVGVDFDRVSLNNDKEIRCFFSLPSSYVNPGFAQQVQDSFFVRHCYPRRSFFDSGSVVSAVVNTAVLGNQHFVDLVCHAGMKLLRFGRFQQGLEQLALFPELRAATVVAVIGQKMDDVEWLRALIGEEFSDTTVQSTVSRIANDFRVLERMQEKLKRVVTLREIRTISIPRELVRESGAAELLSEPLFSVSDHDRFVDREFDLAASLLTDVLRWIKLENENQIEQTMGDMDFRLLDFSPDGILPGLLVDLFSLVFLQKKGKFVCGLKAARNFIAKLITADTGGDPIFSSILKSTHQKLQVLEFMVNDDSLDHLFIPNPSLFVAVVRANEPGLAESLAGVDPKFSRLLALIKDVQKWRSGNPRAILSPAANVEIERCFGTENRMRLWSDFNLKWRFPDETAVEWIIPDGLAAAPLTHGFSTYLSEFLPHLLNTCPAGSALRLSFPGLVAHLFDHGHVDLAEKLASLYRLDLDEVVLEWSHDSDRYAPAPVILARKIAAQQFSESDPVLLRRLARLPASSRRRITDLAKPIPVSFHAPARFDLASLLDLIVKLDRTEAEGVPSDFCLEVLKRLLAEPVLDQDLIVDLAFRVPPPSLEDLIESAISLENLDVLVNVCSVVAPGVVDRLDFLRDIRDVGVSPFPLRSCLQALISRRLYERASVFCAFFGLHINSLPILREEAFRLVKDGAPLGPLLHFFPGLRTDIPEPFPTGLRDDQRPDFFASLPPEWTVHETESATIWANMSDRATVLSILERFPDVSIDHELLQEAPLYMPAGFLRANLDLARRKAWLLEAVAQQVCIDLCRRNIDRSSETAAFQAATIIARSLDECCVLASERNLRGQLIDELPRIRGCARAIASFLSCSLASRFGLSFSLADGLSVKFGRKLLGFCYRFDLLDIAQEVACAWQIEISFANDDYSLAVLSLGLDSDIATDHRLDNSIETRRVIERYISHFTHHSLFDIRLVQALTPKSIDAAQWEFIRLADRAVPRDVIAMRDEHFIWRLRAICGHVLPPPDRMLALLSYLRQNAPLLERLRFSSQTGALAESLTLFCSLPAADRGWVLFRDGILEPVISFNYLAHLRAKFRGFATPSAFRECFDRILQFAGDLGADHLAFEVEILLDRFAGAIDRALALAEDAPNITTALRHLQFAQGIAALAVERGFPLRDRAAQLRLQRRCWEVLPIKDLTLFKGPESAEALVALLFQALHCDLAIDIVAQCKLSPLGIALRIADSLSARRGSDVARFMQGFASQGFGDFFRLIAHTILRRMAFVHGEIETAVAVIMAALPAGEFQCLMLLELGCMEKALMIAQGAGLEDVIALIGCVAARMGNGALAAEAQRELTRPLRS